MVRSWKIVDVNQESSGLRTEPCFGVYLVGQETIHVDLNFILVERSNWNVLYLSPLCQTLSNSFSTSRKAATTCSPLFKLSMMDWDSLNRW